MYSTVGKMSDRDVRQLNGWILHRKWYRMGIECYDNPNTVTYDLGPFWLSAETMDAVVKYRYVVWVPAAKVMTLHKYFPSMLGEYFTREVHPQVQSSARFSLTDKELAYWNGHGAKPTDL